MSSGALLRLEGAATRKNSRGLSLSVMPGDGWALMGDRRSDVDHLYKSLVAGDVERGSVEQPAPASSPFKPGRMNTRATVGGAFKRHEGVASARALSAMGLWDELGREVGALDEEETAALHLAYLLSQPGPLHFLGRWADLLSPWRTAGFFTLLDEVLELGQAVFVSTSRAETAARLGKIVVLKADDPRFAGSVGDLIVQARPDELIVETDEPAAVAAMAAPFTMRVTVLPGELHIQAADGQALAARLLTSGYGHIRSVVVRAPTLEDALLQAT